MKQVDLAAGAVQTGKIANNQVFSEDVRDDTLSAGGLRAADLSPGSVGTSEVDGSLTGADIANRSLTADDLKQPEPWHEVGPASDSQDLCADPSNTAVFCTQVINGPGFTIFKPWHNYSVGFASAGFYRDQLGIVHLKGLVQFNRDQSSSSPFWTPIFRLPRAYRPANIRVFASVGAEHVKNWEVAPSRVDVGSDGLVTWVQDCNDGLVACSGNGVYVTLDGISFRSGE